jgi:hypothetical protein
MFLQKFCKKAFKNTKLNNINEQKDKYIYEKDTRNKKNSIQSQTKTELYKKFCGFYNHFTKIILQSLFIYFPAQLSNPKQS